MNIINQINLLNYNRKKICIYYIIPIYKFKATNDINITTSN